MTQPLRLSIAALLLLQGCASTGTPGPRPPTDPVPEPCPAALAAPLEAEPLPPAGVDVDALYAGVGAALGPETAAAWIQWLEADHAAWARRGWRRLEAARRGCGG